MNQVFAITGMNLRNLPGRLGPSVVVVVGIAGVVLVLIALLSMARGFEATLKGTGQADRAIVLRGGSDSEMTSWVSPQHADLIRTKPGIATGESGVLAATEIYVIADVPKKRSKTDANLPLRGVEARSFEIRNEVRIVDGRSLEFGKFELIAGVNAVDQFQGLDIGSILKLRGADWEVVGHFATDGTIHESEVWVDTQVLGSNLKRGAGGTSMVVRLESPREFDVLEQAMDDDPQLETELRKETVYYSEQSEMLTALIENFGYFVAGIMAIGAIFAALNTMYSAVSTRSVEIATLRALGFGPLPVVVSVMVEALILAMIGGAMGASLAFVMFNGYTASTMGGTFSQVSFAFAVTPDLVVRGVVWSCLLGLAGGLFPSVAAARQPVTVALRGR